METSKICPFEATGWLTGATAAGLVVVGAMTSLAIGAWVCGTAGAEVGAVFVRLQQPVNKKISGTKPKTRVSFFIMAGVKLLDLLSHNFQF